MATFAPGTSRGRGYYGVHGDIAVTLKGETGLGRSFRIKTPAQRAREELAKFFDEIKLNNESLKREFLSEASRIDTMTVMNMPLLGTAYMYLTAHPEADDFSEATLKPYLDPLMRDFIENQKELQKQHAEIRRKYSQRLISYIVKIQTTREQARTEEPLYEEPYITVGSTEAAQPEDL